MGSTWLVQDKFADGAKGTTANGALRDQAGPALDLVEPAGVGGGEVQLVPRASGEPCSDLGVPVRAVVVELACDELGNAASELHHLESALNFALGVAEHLAVFANNAARQFVSVVMDEFAELEKDGGPPAKSGVTPGDERLLRRAHRVVDLPNRRIRQLGALLARGRIEHRSAASG